MPTLEDPTPTPKDPTPTPVDPTPAPMEPVEYSSRCVREGLIHVDHVYFMLFVHLFSSLVCKNYTTRTQFLVEYRLNGYYLNRTSTPTPPSWLGPACSQQLLGYWCGQCPAPLCWSLTGHSVVSTTWARRRHLSKAITAQAHSTFPADLYHYHLFFREFCLAYKVYKLALCALGA